MGENPKVYVGYEMGKEYCQICLCSPETGPEPVSIATTPGGEKIRIPFVLAKRKGIEQWYYGEEAVKKVELQEALEVEQLYEKAVRKETLSLEDREYQAELLFQMYVKKTLGLLISYVPLEKISHCTFCVEQLEKEAVALWKTIFEALPIPKENCNIISYPEGFAYYVASQEEKIWERGVVLFEYDGEELTVKKLQIMKRTIPYLIQVAEQEKVHFEQNDEVFFQFLKQLFCDVKAGTVYLVGDGFQEIWYNESLKLLCQGRRVFKGQNLYGLGAVQYAGIKLRERKRTGVYLGEDQIKVNFFLKAIDRGREVDYEFLSAELHWYEAEKQLEVISGEENEVVIYARGLDCKCEEAIKVSLKDFPVREERATRLGIKMYFKDRQIGVIEVRDLGFGEIYPSSGRVWTEGFDLQLMEQKLNAGLSKM